MRARWWLFLVAVILCGGALAWAAVSGPDPFPTHWGPDGRPDSWGSRGGSVGVLAAVSGGTAILFAAIAAFAPRIPASMINTPHRDYWLTPEHRGELDELLQRSMLAVGVAVQLLIAVSVVSAIVSPEDGAAAGYLIWVFMALIVAAVGYLVWKLFTRPRR